MNRHETDRHEELLPDVLAGEGDPRESFARSGLSSCPECRALFEEITGLAGKLDGAGKDERRALVELGGEIDPPGERLVGRIVEERLRSSKPAESPSPPAEELPRGFLFTPPVVFAAAVMSLVAVGLFLLDRDRTGPEDSWTPMGEQLELLHPVDSVEDFSAFSWKVKVSGSASYRVLVYDATGDRIREPLLESKLLEESPWTPTEAEHRALPNKIRWELRIYDDSGGLITSRFQWAHRQP